MKLNLGCGFNKLQGYLNVDQDMTCQPDMILDIEKTPWPFEDNSAVEILAVHSLEHVGADFKVWLGIIREIYRVLRPGGALRLIAPHHKHDNFAIDPSHVRVITAEGIALFDQLRNIRDFETGGQETKLGLMHGLDLEVIGVEYVFCEPWASGLKSGLMSPEQVQKDFQHLWNVCQEIRLEARAHKPARGADWLSALRMKK